MRYLFALLLLLSPFLARADDSVSYSQVRTYTVTSCGTNTWCQGTFGSITEIANNLGAYQVATLSASQTTHSFSYGIKTLSDYTGSTFPGSCSGTVRVYRDGAAYSDYNFSCSVNQVKSCPDHSAFNSDGVCICSFGYVPDASKASCIKPTCTKGEVSDAGYYDVGVDLSTSPLIFACSAGCVVQFDGVSPAGSAIVNGVKHYYAQGGYYNNGDACLDSGIQGLQQLQGGSQSIPQDTCPSGQYGGTVNGKFVCVDGSGNVVKADPVAPSASSSSDSTTTVTPNPDGSTTVTETTTKTDGSGNSNTTTVTKTCDQAGNCTATTKTTGDKTDDQKSECELHPDSAGCTKLGTAPNSDSASAWSIPMSIKPTDGWTKDASCPADHVIQTQLLGPVALPWGLLCSAADYSRPVVIAVAWLSAVFSFFGISRRGAE